MGFIENLPAVAATATGAITDRSAERAARDAMLAVGTAAEAVADASEPDGLHHHDQTDARPEIVTGRR